MRRGRWFGFMVSQPRFEVWYAFHDPTELDCQVIGGPKLSVDHRPHPALEPRHSRRCLR